MEYAFDVRKIKILSCGIKDCDENWHWDTGEDGFHDYDLWTVFRGRGTLTFGGTKWDASVGDSLLLTPNNRCVGEQDLSDRLLTINVHFNFMDGDEPVFPFVGGAVHHKISDIAFMRDLLYRVIQLFNAGKTDLAEAVFSSALVEFFEQKGLSGESGRDADKENLIRAICDEINTSPSSVPKLPDLAKKYGYSPDYLGRVFRSVTGLSVSDYIKNARINQAKLLLSASSMSVEAIAETLEYYDACYFSRQFKRETGYTPGEYRKNKR
ncbi:MAG: helix-turn-helix transcriptional regulator [Clostridia bacterium]|nr:helix-turn-helix transcriptional regulator [Clostridia bacterium]